MDREMQVSRVYRQADG